VTASREPLTADERAELIRIARESIGAFLGQIHEPTPRFLTPALLAHTGAFVSVYVHEELRGCVGHIFPSEPLHLTVAITARAAAFEDHRFTSLKLGEWSLMTIEISCLTPLEPAPAESIVPGRHGLYVAQGVARGLLLPQVASRYGWTREEFLHATCRKAGLAADAWHDPQTEILVFEADVFRS
jgi:AmmeMemoRadiSam system protein A